MDGKVIVRTILLEGGKEIFGAGALGWVKELGNVLP
jgi:hypothetical protein